MSSGRNSMSSAGISCRVARRRAAAGRSLTLLAARDVDVALPFRAVVYGLDLVAARRPVRPNDALPYVRHVIDRYRLARRMLRAGVTSEAEFVRAAGRDGPRSTVILNAMTAKDGTSECLMALSDGARFPPRRGLSHDHARRGAHAAG
jgi:hypothetical protein